MRILIMYLFLIASAFGYEARLFGAFGVDNTFITETETASAKTTYVSSKSSSSLSTASTELDTSFMFKFGYEQNIYKTHILQVYYYTNLFFSQSIGLNYVYELPVRNGFVGFYGGIDFGVVQKLAAQDNTSSFLSDLNIGVRYRFKGAFIDLGIKTGLAQTKFEKSSLYSTSTTEYKQIYPFGFVFSLGYMFNL